MRPQAVFLDTGSLGEDIDLTPIEVLPIDWMFYPNTLPNEIDVRSQEADIIVTNKVLLNAEVLSQATKLKLICVAATGTNNIDLDAAYRLNIPVKNVTDYATPSVVQHVFMLILALSGRLLDTQTGIKEGQWQQSPFFCLLDKPFSELQGKVLGIIGYGVLGQAVAKVAKAFGMCIQVANIPGRPEKTGRVSLDQLLRTSDVVTLHCPLTDETHNIIDAAALHKMKETVILINTARGGIVNEVDLLRALQCQDIAGAGIDVLREEPPRQGGHCLLSVELPHLIVTPHIAWASRESRQRLIEKLAENIRMHLSA